MIVTYAINKAFWLIYVVYVYRSFHNKSVFAKLHADASRLWFLCLCLLGSFVFLLKIPTTNLKWKLKTKFLPVINIYFSRLMALVLFYAWGFYECSVRCLMWNSTTVLQKRTLGVSQWGKCVCLMHRENMVEWRWWGSRGWLLSQRVLGDKKNSGFHPSNSAGETHNDPKMISTFETFSLKSRPWKVTVHMLNSPIYILCAEKKQVFTADTLLSPSGLTRFGSRSPFHTKKPLK